MIPKLTQQATRQLAGDGLDDGVVVRMLALRLQGLEQPTLRAGLLETGKEGLVDENGASWNQIGRWVSRIPRCDTRRDALPTAASALCRWRLAAGLAALALRSRPDWP